MSRLHIRPWLAALLAGLLLAPLASAQDRSHGVRDRAGLFSAEAERKATEAINRIKSKYHKDLLIETEEKGPSREKLDTYTRERFKTLGVDGVYVYIAKNPRELEVRVGNHTKEAGQFEGGDRRELFEIFQKNLKSRDFDAALLEGVEYVQTTLSAGAPAPARKTAPREGGGPAAAPGAQHVPEERGGGLGRLFGGGLCGLLCVGLAIVGVIMLVVRLIGGLFGGGGGGGYGPGGYGPGFGGGGGGFFTSMLGGLFGAAAGSWIYHNMFGGGGSSAMASPPDHAAAAGSDMANDATGPDTDSTGTGGDWGDGGDAGAGDAGGDAGGDWGGGGDVGGGDFFGGGGDFGGGDGGGGDW